MNKQKNKSAKSRKRIILLSKLTVTLLLVFLIFIQVDWNELVTSLLKVNPILVLCVVAMMLFNITISSLKWQFLLSIHNIHIRLFKLTGYYFTSMFLSNFLPGNIGGDSYRIYKVYTRSKSKSASVLPILAERVTGIITLIMMGFIGAIISYWENPIQITRITLIVSGMGTAVCVLVSVLIFMEKPVQFILNLRFIPAILKKAVGYLPKYRLEWKKVALCFAISILFYLILFGARLILLVAVGQYCSIYNISLVVMLSNIMGAIPISLNGIGLIDGSFIFLISNYGVSYESGVIVMVLHRTISVFVSLSGIYFYYRNQEPPPEPMDIDL